MMMMVMMIIIVRGATLDAEIFADDSGTSLYRTF
jgi:hypothetical protein